MVYNNKHSITISVQLILSIAVISVQLRRSTAMPEVFSDHGADTFWGLRPPGLGESALQFDLETSSEPLPTG